MSTYPDEHAPRTDAPVARPRRSLTETDRRRFGGSDGEVFRTFGLDLTSQTTSTTPRRFIRGLVHGATIEVNAHYLCPEMRGVLEGHPSTQSTFSGGDCATSPERRGESLARCQVHL